MKKLLLVLALAAIAIPVANAGGWATVGLSSLPDDMTAGSTWSVEMTVLRHGRTPLEGIAPVLTIRKDDGNSRQFTGTPTGTPGVYHAEVVFPTSGSWSYEVWDGFSRAHTFKSVEIGAPGGGSFPLPRLGLALALALALAVATILFLRRNRPAQRPAGLKEAL